MEPPEAATRAVVAVLAHWLGDDEIKAWLRACDRYAEAQGDPLPVVRAVVADLLEAKAVVDRYRSNDQEGPDPFAAELAGLVRALPPGPGGPGPDARARAALELHTREVLERCQRRRRRPAWGSVGEAPGLPGGAG